MEKRGKGKGKGRGRERRGRTTLHSAIAKSWLRH